MTLAIDSEAQIIREAADVLMAHLSPSKFARFWATWQVGQGDYLIWRDTVFGDRTVESIVAEIRDYENSESEHPS